MEILRYIVKNRIFCLNYFNNSILTIFIDLTDLDINPMLISVPKLFILVQNAMTLAKIPYVIITYFFTSIRFNCQRLVV